MICQRIMYTTNGPSIKRVNPLAISIAALAQEYKYTLENCTRLALTRRIACK